MNNYQTVRLGDVCEIVMGTSPEGNTISQNASDGIEFHQGKTCFGDLYLNESGMFTNAPVRFADAGNVIMSVRAPVGDSNITPRKIAIGRGLCTFNTKSNFEKLFLYYYLNSKIDFLKSKSTGSTFKAVNKDVISDLKIPLPPLSEQKRIATVLDKCTEVIAKHREMLDKYDTLVKSQFVEMFGDPVQNSMDWEVKKLNDVAPAKAYKGSVDYPVWLLNLDMIESQTGRIIEYIMALSNEIGNSTVSFDEENVLYSKLRPYLNKVVVPTRKGVCTTELVPLRPDSKYLNKIFLANLLRSKSFVDFISEKVAGAKMPRVSMEVFRDFNCILPPLELQEKFAAFVQAVDAQKAKAQESLDKAETLYKALMQEYFG